MSRKRKKREGLNTSKKAQKKPDATLEEIHETTAKEEAQVSQHVQEEQGTRREFLKSALKLAGVGFAFWGVKKAGDAFREEKMEDKKKITETLETLPEDPKQLFTLDESWRSYAKKSGKTLKEIADTLYTELHQANTFLREYFPALPEDLIIRLCYTPRSDYQGALSQNFGGQYYSQRTIHFNPGQLPTFSPIKGGERIDLPELDQLDPPTLCHELCHAYNQASGLMASKILNEGLATFLGDIFARRFNKYKDRASKSHTKDLLSVFPELQNMPMNVSYSPTESEDTWAAIGEVYYVKASQLIREWETKHPGFVKAWISHLNSANQQTLTNNGVHLNIKEIFDSAEAAQSGSLQYFVEHPSMQMFGEQYSEYLSIKISNDTFYGMNLASGLRKVIHKDHGEVSFTDLLPVPPKIVWFYSSSGEKLGEITASYGFSAQSVSEIEEQMMTQSEGRYQKISHFKYQLSNGQVVTVNR
jgi:hypothetical protein